MRKDYVDAHLNCEVGESVSVIRLSECGLDSWREWLENRDQIVMASSPSIMDGIQYDYIIRDGEDVYAIQSIDLDFEV